jgi:hypothetical protein
MAKYKIMIMGASYGSLLASKILFGGHSVHLICLPAEADLINAEGFRVRLPVKGRKDPVVLDSTKLPGKVTAGPATGVNPKDYDLIGLAMQEPQYRSAGDGPPCSDDLHRTTNVVIGEVLSGGEQTGTTTKSPRRGRRAPMPPGSASVRLVSH